MQAARLLPNRDELFVSLDNLITSAQRQRQTASYDSAKFFFVRRLQENERILAILTLMIEGSFTCKDGLISDLRLCANGPNIVAPTMLEVVACVLAVVCKRMQQLPKSLGPAVHRGKNTTHTSL